MVKWIAIQGIIVTPTTPERLSNGTKPVKGFLVFPAYFDLKLGRRKRES